MLPREADPAERLHAVLAVEERGVERERGRGRDREAGAVVERRRGARAASHTAARASSVRASMSAQRCFTPWNWPIGRPNCTRTFAYSAAVSTHHCATPIASAASNTAARSRTRSDGQPGQPAIGGRATPSRSSCATRRVRSMLGNSVTPAAARVERGPRAVDLAHDHVGVVAAEHRIARRSSATAPVHSPVAELREERRRRGTARFLQDRGREHRRDDTGRARTRDRAPRPRRPARRARSPRRRSPRRRADPSQPGSPIAAQNSGRARRRRRRPLAAPRGGMRASTKRRTACRSSSCSSVIPIAMPRWSQCGSPSASAPRP